MAEHVIVLHGLALNKYWMMGVAGSLKRRGYIVHSISYPTRDHTFEQIVDQYLKPLVQSIPAKKVHFAVHSMGGLLVRLYAEKYGVDRIGRVVMIGTPNHGSEVADSLSHWWLYRRFFAGAGQELVTGQSGVAARLGPVRFECGVIAGKNHWFHFPTAMIAKELPKPNDGLVSVASTKVDGMKDHVVIWLDHTLMVWSGKVWRQTAYFLKNGNFSL